ncbi:MAG: rhomboid family intramembrane serine protease [Dysgonamonadaceae bacterium]|jgi:membrane associated rhomboid family serine protease|nr:rhomboid family intramembrane serine protease [Dysgonamonadaceae bacterium]
MANYQNNSIFNTIAPVTKNILIINFIIWVGCYMTKANTAVFHLADMLGLHFFSARGFNIFQLITYMFTHVDSLHLFCNMFALFMFGSVVERTWGTKRYLIYYFTTGIGAGLVQMLVWYIQIMNDAIPIFYVDFLVTIGASGAVFGLLLAFVIMFPNAPLYLMFIPVPIKAKYMVAGYGIIELIYGVSNRSGDNIAHFAHLGGMLFGIILILYWQKNYIHYRPGWLYNTVSKLWKRKKKMKIKYKRPETDWEYNARKQTENKDIDRILDKIKCSGYNSLSDDEKKKLFDFGKK